MRASVCAGRRIPENMINCVKQAFNFLLSLFNFSYPSPPAGLPFKSLNGGRERERKKHEVNMKPPLTPTSTNIHCHSYSCASHLVIVIVGSGCSFSCITQASNRSLKPVSLIPTACISVCESKDHQILISITHQKCILPHPLLSPNSSHWIPFPCARSFTHHNLFLLVSLMLINYEFHLNSFAGNFPL